MHPDEPQMPEPGAPSAQPDDGADALFAAFPDAVLGVTPDGRRYVDTGTGLRFALPFLPVPPGHPDF